MTSPTPDNSAAADSKYLALWTPDDKRFCAYWCHQLVLPLLHDILGFKTIVENWNEFKDAVVRDINAASQSWYCLLKREFTKQMLEDVDVVLLDVCKLGTGPPDWKAVCIHESYKPAVVPEGFWFPPVDGITTNKALRSLMADPTVRDPMPLDLLAPKPPRPRRPLGSPAPTVVASSSRVVVPRTPEPPTPSQPSKKRRSIEEDAETMRAAVLAFEASGSPSSKRARTNAVVQRSAMTASKPPGYGGLASVEVIPDSEERKPPPSTSDEDNDDDVEMVTPLSEGRSLSQAQGQEEGYFVVRIDPQEYAQSISSAIVKRQGNRKATGLQLPQRGVPHVLSLVRWDHCPSNAYNGFPVDMPGKRAKTVGSPLEGKKLTMASFRSSPASPPSLLNCMILARTPSSCQYNKDARYVVDLSRRLGEWTGATPEHFLHLSCGLEEAIEAADAARQVADAAALRVAKYFSAISLSALAIVDKFGPLTLAQCFDDESPEAIANFFNGAIADYNRMHAGAATLKARLQTVWSSADLVSPGALEALQRELGVRALNSLLRTIMATATPGGPVLTAIPAYQDPSSPLSLAVATLLNRMQPGVLRCDTCVDHLWFAIPLALATPAPAISFWNEWLEAFDQGFKDRWSRMQFTIPSRAAALYLELYMLRDFLPLYFGTPSQSTILALQERVAEFNSRILPRLSIMRDVVDGLYPPGTERPESESESSEEDYEAYADDFIHYSDDEDRDDYDSYLYGEDASWS
ncbi:hypothetical protein B0H12DRAFT_1239388 [Mycena haematopus]|nr:hypothetical protein B0H12DRAFT_1239388 [Mycena haematopus]